MAITVLGSQAEAAPLVTGGLTVYFDFEEILTTDLVGVGASGRLVDKSGNDYGLPSTHQIGEINAGDAADTTPGTFALGAGKIGNGGTFTQSTEGFDLPVFVTVDGKHLTDNHFSSIPASSNAITVAAWINTTKNDDGDQSIFQGRTSFPGHGAPHFQLQGNGKFRTTFRNQTGTTIVNANQVFPNGDDTTGDPYPINEWFHYAATYDKATDVWSQYYNGAELQTGASEAGTDGNLGDWGGQEAFGDFFAAGFGAVYDSGGRRFDGTLDELYVFNRALDASEIFTLFDVDGGSAADLDEDGDVDGADFLAIQRTDPSLIPTWEADYAGGALAAGVGAVPEPSTLLLASLAACFGVLHTRRKK